MRNSLTTTVGVLLVLELSNSLLMCMSAKRSSQATASFLGTYRSSATAASVRGPSIRSSSSATLANSSSAGEE